MAITRLAVSAGLSFGRAGDYETIELAGSGLSAVTSGDVVVGDGTTGSTDLVGVAMADYVDATTPIAFVVDGVLNLPVTGKNNAGNAAVVVGDAVYLDGTEINKDSVDGTFLGYAMEAVASAATTTIRVLFRPMVG